MIYKGSFILQHTELKKKKPEQNKRDADWQTLGTVGNSSMRKEISLQKK